jgi:hypothetical protein
MTGDSSNDRSAETDAIRVREFRLPGTDLVRVVWMSALVLVCLGLYGWAAATNFDGSFTYPRAVAAVVAVCWCGVALGSVSIVLFTRRHRLIFSGDTLREIGALGERLVSSEHIRRVYWRGSSGRRVAVLLLPRSQISIAIDSYPASERDDLIDRLREFTGHAEQLHWDRFCQHIDSPGGDARKRQIRWAGTIFAVLLLLVAVPFAADAANGSGWRRHLVRMPLLIPALFWATEFRRRQRE